MIDQELSNLDEEGVQLHHIGRLDRISQRLRQKVLEAIEQTKDNENLILNVAFDYGGRAEIVDAVRQIIAERVPAEEVDEELIGEHLYTAGYPDPDLIIRTSGEMRLSNFLVWQAAYAELYVTPRFWPDFNKEELYKALVEYNRRDRRFGLIPQ